MLKTIPKYNKGEARKIGRICFQEHGRAIQNRKRVMKASLNRESEKRTPA